MDYADLGFWLPRWSWKTRADPVAAAFWAQVSADVDRKLSENLAGPIRLRPDEWRSGEILWLIDAVGDSRALPTFLKHLQENVFKGRPVKMRTRGPDGRAVAGVLGAPKGSWSSSSCSVSTPRFE